MSDLDAATRVVELVRAGAGAAAEAEVVVDRTTVALTRFANSYIHQNMADEQLAVRLRLHLDGRTATGSTSLTTADALGDLVERTIAAARLCPPDPSWPGLAPPAPLTWSSEAVDGAEPADRAAQVAAFIEATGGLEAAGYCSTSRMEYAFANSAGQSLTAGAAEAELDGIARLAGGSVKVDGVARQVGGHVTELDGARLGARAAAKATAGADPVELPPGRYEVVLEPTAAWDVVDTLGYYAFNGKIVNERRSCLRPGEQQFDPAITLVDAPTGLPFDVEGTVKRRLVLVDRGVTRAVVHDRRSARVAGTDSTGHAVPGGSAWGAVPTSLGVEAGGPEPAEAPGPAADAAVAALVARVKRGLLVTDNWYTRVLDPLTLAVTGLTRNGVWLIENGEVTKPVQNLRFTQSYPLALAPGAVLGVGDYAVPLSAGFGGGTMRIPALHLASWNFTGNASG